MTASDPFTILLDGALVDLHRHIDRRCAGELLRTKVEAERARRSLGQRFRWVAAELTGGAQ